MVKIFESNDGSTSLFHEEYGVSYHSKYGAIQEGRHVFIGAGMHSAAIGRERLSILEMGFGSGLNAFLTFMEAERLGISVEYVGIEQSPLPMKVVGQLNFPEKLDTARADFEKLHSAKWGDRVEISSCFSLRKIESPIQSVMLDQKFEVIYFDAFAPNVQPELWGEEVLEKCFGWLKPGGVLVTYCAKGAFKRALRSVGFEVEALKGPPGKREMTRAVRP